MFFVVPHGCVVFQEVKQRFQRLPNLLLAFTQSGDINIQNLALVLSYHSQILFVPEEAELAPYTVGTNTQELCSRIMGFFSSSRACMILEYLKQYLQRQDCNLFHTGHSDG